MDAQLLTLMAKNAHMLDIYPDARFPPAPYYRFMGLLAEYYAPSICVELGVCGGGCCLHMALHNPDGRVIGVDVRNDYPRQIEYIESTCPSFEFWQMDSIDAALVAATTEITYPVTILFIDTIHTKERTVAEFDAWRPLLDDRAVVVLDDLFRPGMIEAWDRIPGKRVRLDDLHIGGAPTDGGFGVIWNPEGWN